MNRYSVLGQNIERIARESGLTLEQLAERSGMYKGNLSRIMRTGKGYSADSLQAIAGVLRVSLDTLFADPNVPRVVRIRPVPILTNRQILDHLNSSSAITLEHGSDVVVPTTIHSVNAFGYETEDISMRPEYLPKDILVVDPDMNPLPTDDVLALVHGQVVFRRYMVRSVDDHGVDIYSLVPLSDGFPSYVSERDHIKIVGTVMERRRIRNAPYALQAR